MNDDEVFRDLLQAADRSASRVPEVQVNFPRALQVHKRRTQRQVLAVAAAVTLIAAGSFLFWQPGEHLQVAEDSVAPSPTDTANSKPNHLDPLAPVPPQPEPDISGLVHRASRTSDLVHQVLEARRWDDRIAALQRQLLEEDAVLLAQIEIDRAAAISLYHADTQLAHGSKADAAKAYDAVVIHFPQSPSAGLARQRLAQLVH